MKRVLHVGCGKQPLPDFIDDCEEIRMDINPECNPDIVADLTSMGDIGGFDVVFGCHVLEHFTTGEAKTVLEECKRVLKPGGITIMIVPNLENVRPTRDVVYVSEAGPITGFDMFYGKESFVDDFPFMSHKAGYVSDTLKQAFSMFKHVQVRELADFNLMAVGVKIEETSRD